MTADPRSISPELLNSIRKTFKDFVANYPDIPALVADGKLIDMGRGWYEVQSGKTYDELVKYVDGLPKSVNGKIRIKFRKLTKKIEATAARL